MTDLKILIIEDDAAIRRGIVDALDFSGYETIQAGDALTGTEKAIQVDYDLLLLDLHLPGGDGLDILKKVRESLPTLPVIILTARGSEDDRVTGLKLGADDYVVKPFSIRELLARIDAVLRRSAERPLDVQQFALHNLVIDFINRSIKYDDGSQLVLSEREIELLRYLVCNPGRPISRTEILERVWRMNAQNIETRTVDMHIARLREKLRDTGDTPKIIITVRGQGYRFDGVEEK